MNIPYRILVLTVIILSVGLIASCEKEYLKPVETPQIVSYSADMQPYFDAKCVSCHNGGSVPLNLEASVSYDNLINGGYVDTGAPSNSSLYTKVDAGGSMESYANQAERDLTLRWIEQGALNN